MIPITRIWAVTPYPAHYREGCADGAGGWPDAGRQRYGAIDAVASAYCAGWRRGKALLDACPGSRAHITAAWATGIPRAFGS